MESKSTPMLLALLALGVGYLAWTGTLISAAGVPGIQTRMAHADTLRDSLKMLEARIETAKRDIAKESVEDVKKRVQAYSASLSLLRTLVPEQSEVANLLDDVTMRARVRGVRMTGFEPLPSVPGPAPFDTRAYRFVVVGHYNQVGDFLTDIASLRRIMVPSDVRMVAANAAQGRAFGDTTAMLEAHFTVRTYVKAKAVEDSTNGK